MDSEQRVMASRVMKRWIMSSKRAAFVVEHDFIMATYLADKVIVFDGQPAKDTFCSAPESLVSGMNTFLKMMDITFRRDPNNFRPRINKNQSVKDVEQKKTGNYFLMEESMAALRKKKELLAAAQAEAKGATAEAEDLDEEEKEEVKEYQELIKKKKKGKRLQEDDKFD